MQLPITHGPGCSHGRTWGFVKFIGSVLYKPASLDDLGERHEMATHPDLYMDPPELRLLALASASFRAPHVHAETAPAGQSTGHIELTRFVTRWVLRKQGLPLCTSASQRGGQRHNT